MIYQAMSRSDSRKTHCLVRGVGDLGTPHSYSSKCIRYEACIYGGSILNLAMIRMAISLPRGGGEVTVCAPI